MSNFPGNGGHYRTSSEKLQATSDEDIIFAPKERHWGRWITLCVVLGIVVYFFRYPIRNKLAEIGIVQTNAFRIGSLNTTVYFPRQLHLALGGWVVDQHVLLVNDKDCTATSGKDPNLSMCYIVAAGPWFTRKLPGQPDIEMQNLVETQVVINGKELKQQTYTTYSAQREFVNVTRVLIPFIPDADFAVTATYATQWEAEAQRMVKFIAERVSLPKNLPTGGR